MSRTRLAAASLVRLLGVWHSPKGRGPAWRQLYETLRLLILDGRLPLSVRLPGERDLALALGLSRTTVAAAYAQLRAENYLASRHGSGSFTRLPSRPGARPPTGLDGAIGAGTIEMSVASLPATELVHAAYAAGLAALPAHLPGSGYGAFGLDELREAIAVRYARRGVPTTPDQVFVTQGGQHGFSLLLGLLAGPGDRILVDHPTYPLALDAIQRASCRAVPVPLSPSGWDSGAIDAAFRQAGPRLAFLLPDFHNPTGLCMDVHTRAAIVASAARARTILAVDETMADLWLDEPPPAPMAAHDRDGIVVSLGSTSKSFWGGLRVGWVRADSQIVAGLARVRASVDLGTPILEQLAASILLTHDDSILDARRHALRRHRDILVETAGDLLPEWRLPVPTGGLSVWAELPRPRSTVLAAAADAAGVRIAPGTRFGVDGAFERFVRLPFALSEADLKEGLHRLATAWRQVSGGVVPQPGRDDIAAGPGAVI